VPVFTNEPRSMKSLAKLKDDARRHEQREEWQDAIDLYLKVLRSAEDGETELELPLYNRIGDLFIRLGKPADAVRHYEQAADHYAEAGLFNNAIALCNKALRYLPTRVALFRKLGKYSASQGFLTDARRWFLEYAEYMVQKGDLDEAFAALHDFAEVTDDPDVRADYARRLASHQRPEAAYGEFRKAYAGWLRAGDAAAAERLRLEVRESLPSSPDLANDVDALAITPAAGRVELPGYADDARATAVEHAAVEGADESEEVAEPLPTYDDEPASSIGYAGETAAAEQGETGPLAGLEPTALGSEKARPAVGSLEGLESTRIGTQDVDAVHEIEGLDTSAEEEEGVEPLPLLGDEYDRAGEELDAGDDSTPLPLLDSAAVDDRHAADDIYGVATVDVNDPASGGPPATGADYVDLAAFINPVEERVRATRFFVEEKPPTGDEDRDFAEMLAEFKAKVAEHVGEDDSGSHYDLGLAYKEMGLIDEAIGEFQVALRAGAKRLKVFEELGQCFILKRQPTIAIKILGRALQTEHSDELEMIGVFYHLGRAHEELGQTTEARDAYERVLGLDIGFMDVMDRVTRL